jgi:hypothetical protein
LLLFFKKEALPFSAGLLVIKRISQLQQSFRRPLHPTPIGILRKTQQLIGQHERADSIL